MSNRAEWNDAVSDEGPRDVGGGGEASAVALTLEEKEALINTRAEERRSAIRREALGWDRWVVISSQHMYHVTSCRVLRSMSWFAALAAAVFVVLVAVRV